MGIRDITISAAWPSLGRQQKGRRQRVNLASSQAVYFDALYEQYSPAICAFLHFLVGKPEVAEKVWTHFDDIRPQDAVDAWLFRIACEEPRPRITGANRLALYSNYFTCCQI